MFMNTTRYAYCVIAYPDRVILAYPVFYKGLAFYLHSRGYFPIYFHTVKHTDKATFIAFHCTSEQQIPEVLYLHLQTTGK